MSPTSLKHPCSIAGCAAPVETRGRCAEHAKQHERAREAFYRAGNTVRHLYASPRWARLRARVLARHPLCASCYVSGRTTAATEVHHIVRAADVPERFFDEANLQPLCKSCHSAETAREVGFIKGGQ